MLHTALVNGIHMAYEDIGRPGDPAILLVHGYPLSRQMWRAQHETVRAAGFRGILPDLRGHGQTEVPPPPYSLDQFADDLAALLDYLEVDQTVVCGLSMGGYTSFAFWRKYPERVRALVLADTQHKPDSDEGRQNRFKAIEQVQAGQKEQVVQAMIPRLIGQTSLEVHPKVADEVRAIFLGTADQGIVGALHALAGRPDSTPTLATVNIPTLIIVGEEDILTPPALHEEIHAGIPDSQLIVIPRAGHMAPMEAPVAFNYALWRFLTRLR